MSVALRSLSAAAALLLCQIEAAPARSLDMIRATGALHLCAHPNSLPYANKAGNPPGFQIELGRALAKELGVTLVTANIELEGIVSKRAAYAPGNRGHCTSFSIPIAICRRRIPVAPASRPTRSRLRPPATCRPSDPLHRGAARYFPRNSSMDVRCCGVRNDIVGAGQDCSRGPD